MTALLVCAFAAALSAQDASQIPVFRAGVEIVRIDVRVTDSQGRPLRDLRQDEVEIVEGGERRPVVLFQHIAEPAESYADIARQTVAGEVSTNQGAARGRLYVLLFDQLHIAPGNEQRVRIAAQRFVETRLRPGDRVALYALPGPGPRLGFVADGRRIAAELMKVRGMAQPQAFGALGSMTVSEAFQIVRGNEQTLQRVADRFQSQLAPTDFQRRTDPAAFGGGATPLVALIKEDARKIADVADGETRRLLAMCADVLRPLRAVEGRKTVLFVSEGFYADRLAHEIDDVAAAAAESYSVINALEVNRRLPDITDNEPTGADQATSVHDKTTPLGSLAAETGGMLVLDASQRADDALATIVDGSQDYYLVGFTPGERSLKERGGFRPVTVRVRRSGAQVNTRTGFTLTAAAARMNRHEALDRAMAAPFAQQGLPIQYTTYVLRGSATGLQQVILSLAVDLPVGDAERGGQQADVGFIVRRVSDGQVAATGRDVIRLPERRSAAGTTGTGTYHVQFEVPGGEYLMRAVVREPGGLVGSADRRFTVRALDGPALAGGDLVLSSVRGELPVRPTAYTSDGLNGVMELYGRTTDQLREARVSVDLVPIGESDPSATGFADMQEIRTTAGGAAREARIEIPLQGVTPGMYVARARVMSGADTVSDVVREVEVRDGARPQTADDAGDGDFNPSDIVNGAVARRYADAMHTAAAGSANALRGLDRLAARDYAAAIAAFEAALAASPGNGATAFLLGWAFHGAGDDRRAISAWRRSAYLDPALVPAHLALADIYVHLAQPALAVQALKAGLAALPRSPELLDRLAQIERR